jgi:hypothetical protein
MEKPRRRAAGRPAGPPNPTAVEPVPVETDISPPAGESTGGDASADPGGRERSQPAGHRRRQRLSKGRSDGEEPASRPAPEIDVAQDRMAAVTSSAGRDDRRRGESAMERSLRALVSLRSTQVTPTVAMRAREVATPTAADLAEAEKELVIVRRYYVPPAPLTTSKKGEEPGASRSFEPRSRADSRRAGRKPPRGS